VEILKALSRDTRVLVLDEPTAVLSPNEAAGLFAMLRRLVQQGMTVIFISHKLHEVLALASRVVVLRQGRLVADESTAGASAARLAELMVGRTISPTVLPAQAPGARVARLAGVTLARRDGSAALDGIKLAVAAGQIVGVAGVSGNGQSELAALLSGQVRPDSGTVELFGEVVKQFSPRAMMERNVGRIPEDRHATGVAGMLPLWENAVLEQYRAPAFARRGWRRLQECRRYAAGLIRDFDIRGGGEDGRTSLLSGGNMQKLILGRVLSRAPRLIVASHPTRGLDVGAIQYVHQRLIEARRAGAAIVLISDDLNEVMEMSDQIVVMYQGRISEAFDRNTVDMQAIGLAMAGGGSRAH
jgi:simple sugar transport system ATP-binding protein